MLHDAATFRDHITDRSWSTSAYPRNIVIPEAQREPPPPVPTVEPASTSVVLFPGQGSQFVGMGKKLLDYPTVPEMFEAASEILGFDLRKICLEGPDLNMTVHNQPALLVTSLAALQKLKAEHPTVIDNCVATAGFSVGEYAALVFAGAISFEAAVRIVKIRSEVMQAAWQLTPSGSATVYLRPDARLNYACKVAREFSNKMGIENPQCAISGYMFPGCKWIAGNRESLHFIEMNARDFGIQCYKPHRLTGPFHTCLMKPAEPALKEILGKVEIRKPMINVYSNFDGKCYMEAKDIRRRLVSQISGPVRWEQIMQTLYLRKRGRMFPNTFECGPGSKLKSVLGFVNLPARLRATNIEV